MIYDSILATVGETPIVELHKLTAGKARLFVKLESSNPGGSIKDRLAMAVIEQAELEGVLKPGQTVVEATSGNTGIGLAMVCAAKGYPLVIVMAESFSVERRRLMRFLGAKVVLTPAALKGSGMYRKALELSAAHGWFLPRQFENEANAQIHEHATGQEILRAFEGRPLDYVVVTAGTGGTIKGVARAIRRARPQTRIVLAEAENANLVGSGVAQPPPIDGVPQSHPRFQPHPIQGTTPDFISKLLQDALDAQLVDEVVPVSGAEAMRLARELATREGVLAGISSGAALAAAVAISERAPDASILCILGDTGERYLSTPLFENVGAEMSEEEKLIAASTPSAQFGAGSPPSAAVSAKPADPEAAEKLAALIASEPVVLFALEWCEFCWSLRKLLNAVGVPYRDVALDAAALQADDLGLRLRSALTARTGVPTVPQLFIGGEPVGGCMDAFAAFRSGALARDLAGAGVTMRTPSGLVPESFLPGWLLQKPKVPQAAE
ncbi:MAG TPA: pyridoxal-phosphate dependent enzyme [Phenylobacterium sp.]